MPSRSPLSRLLLLLCALAVLVAQGFGVVRGYICDCGGEAELVKAASCVGPHGENCHTETDQRSDAPDGKNGGDRKDHQVLRDDFQVTKVTAPPIVIAAPVLLAVLPELFSFCAGANEAPRGDYSEALGGPPLLALSTRTFVLRI